MKKKLNSKKIAREISLFLLVTLASCSSSCAAGVVSAWDTNTISLKTGIPFIIISLPILIVSIRGIRRIMTQKYNENKEQELKFRNTKIFHE